MTQPTPRTKVNRLPDRGVYDRKVIDLILDEAICCHVGFVDEGQPYVIPTIHVRIDDRLFIHGAKASRMLRCLTKGVSASIAVTLIDGLVLARSAFHHSLNYRSVVILGYATEIVEREEKEAVLQALTEHIIPGRWEEVRKPTEAELKGTAVLSFELSECSAKIRSGPPSDDGADYELSVWAGVLPLSMTAGEPITDPKYTHGQPVPDYVKCYQRRI